MLQQEEDGIDGEDAKMREDDDDDDDDDRPCRCVGEGVWPAIKASTLMKIIHKCYYNCNGVKLKLFSFIVFGICYKATSPNCF